MSDSNYQFATSSSEIGSSLPVEMLEAAAQALIAFDGEHPSAPWEFYAEAALGAAGVLALLEERDRLRDALEELAYDGRDHERRGTGGICNACGNGWPCAHAEGMAALRGGSE